MDSGSGCEGRFRCMDLGDFKFDTHDEFVGSCSHHKQGRKGQTQGFKGRFQVQHSRKVAVINLDPANDSLLYECAMNIEDLVKLSDVMVEHSLGPNGGLVFCMDYLEKNIDWLQAKLEPLLKDHYLLFDFPGQVELFFLHSNDKNVIMKLIKKLNLRVYFCSLHLADVKPDPGKYISALLLSLSTMLHLELPHINVLSKIDLIESYGRLAFNLDFYTDVQDLSYLQYQLDQDPRSAKYRFQVKKKQFFVNFITIVLFGVVGTLISCTIITLGVTQIFKRMHIGSLEIKDYLAIGAIFAATDSVCTLQVLNQDETHLLYSLVFVVHSTDREVALMMLMAYLSYMLAELWYLSGILTVFFCGIVMSHYTWQ